MDKIDKEEIIQRYNSRLKEYGDDIRTLASGTEERRRIRYKVLSEIGLLPRCSLLDIGCGFGDFYNYLSEQCIQMQYVGYDINPSLIEIAQTKYPIAQFEVKDIQTDPFPKFDYIVSTSSFNLRLNVQDNYQFIEEIMRLCYDHAKRGVAVDFLSSYVDFESPEAFHYKPETVFSIAKKITKRVCLRHDYPLYEFCIYLYPDFQGWRIERAGSEDLCDL
jgi:ubiquinone/menaquinone biosynthesis C-methylase UbiE